MKKLKIEETKATKQSTFKTDIIKVGLDFSISNFFIDKIALANGYSCSNFALHTQDKSTVEILQNFVAFSELYVSSCIYGPFLTPKGH